MSFLFITMYIILLLDFSQTKRFWKWLTQLNCVKYLVKTIVIMPIFWGIVLRDQKTFQFSWIHNTPVNWRWYSRQENRKGTVNTWQVWKWLVLVRAKAPRTYFPNPAGTVMLSSLESNTSRSPWPREFVIPRVPIVCSLKEEGEHFKMIKRTGFQSRTEILESLVDFEAVAELIFKKRVCCSRWIQRKNHNSSFPIKVLVSVLKYCLLFHSIKQLK